MVVICFNSNVAHISERDCFANIFVSHWNLGTEKTDCSCSDLRRSLIYFWAGVHPGQNCLSFASIWCFFEQIKDFIFGRISNRAHISERNFFADIFVWIYSIGLDVVDAECVDVRYICVQLWCTRLSRSIWGIIVC